MGYDRQQRVKAERGKTKTEASVMQKQPDAQVFMERSQSTVRSDTLEIIWHLSSSEPNLFNYSNRHSLQKLLGEDIY